jgi:hypothetical protein
MAHLLVFDDTKNGLPFEGPTINSTGSATSFSSGISRMFLNEHSRFSGLPAR